MKMNRYQSASNVLEEKYKLAFERNNGIFLIKNQTFPIVKAQGIDDMFVLHRELVEIRVAPTYDYIGRVNIEDKNLKCYYDNINETLLEVQCMKINSKSKFNKMKVIYKEHTDELQGINNTCPLGCSECCSDVFYVSEMEFLYMLSSLILNKKHYKLLNLYQQSRLQEEYIKENFERDYVQIIDKYETSDVRYYNLGHTVQCAEKCPMLNKHGKCMVYDARPVICRLYGSTSTCAKSNNIARPHLGKNLTKVVTVCYKGEDLYSQPRPIWYFGSRFLKSENMIFTLDILKSFIRDSEDDFFEKYNKIIECKRII